MAEPYDDDFEEDGCTMDFFDETPDPSSAGTMATTSASGPVVYRHYEGEDFSQYLNDEDEDPQQHNHWGGEPVPSGLPSDDRSYSRRRISTANIREKLGRLLLLPGTSGGRSRTTSTLAPPQQNSLNRITDISFADCKMGNVDRGAASEGSVLGSDSGIDCRSGFSLETESDLGVQASSTWWDMDSLSSKRQPRSSASAIDLPRSVAGYSSNGSGREQRRLDRPEAARSSGGHGGYESGAVNREPAQKQSDHRERTDGGGTSKRLTNSFRKIYNTLSRRKPANLQPNMSHDPDYEDIRL